MEYRAKGHPEAAPAGVPVAVPADLAADSGEEVAAVAQDRDAEGPGAGASEAAPLGLKD